MRATMLSILLLVFCLTGCTSRPTVNDANNFLLIQAELVKLKAYRESILSCRDDLVCVPINYKPDLTEPPQPNFLELSKYLDTNDCTLLKEREAFNQCYRELRVRLIKTTETLDAAVLDNYVLNRTGAYDKEYRCHHTRFPKG